jgi:8-oxo-dGTP pyrophosphatase MutT (NUDIX family)
MSEIWKTRSCKTLLERPPWFEVLVEEVELPGGKVVSDYHQIRMPDYTAVFAVTREKKIMVMRCYRHAVGEVTLTMPGGMLEKGEDPLAGIQRELLEETGYVAEEWKSLGAFWGNSARGCGYYHLFFASGAHQTKESDSGDLEELELLLWTRSEVEAVIDTGQARSLGVMTMLLLGLRCLK